LAVGAYVAIAEPVRTAKAAAWIRVWRAVVRWRREPLLHFMIAGALVFGLAQAWRSAHDVHRIVVTPERTAELAEKYRLQFGANPTAAQLERLVDDYVREEALYREAVAQGLGQDDEIVRRRLAQKLTFLLQDRALPAEPGAAELRRWFEAHAGDYAAPVRTSFHHLYFSTDAVGEGPARVRAEQALSALTAGAAPEAVGADPFPDQGVYVRLSGEEAQRLFGDSPLAKALDTAPAGRWSGPYLSGYGWHLVYVDARAPAAQPEFDAVRERVREDWLQAAREAANDKAVARVVDGYAVVRRDREARP
jgi:hypothetical protein